MGTALTDPQVDALRRLAPTVLFCQDPDTAGQEAVKRGTSAVRALNTRTQGRGLDFRIVRLPAGKDPADVVQQDGAEAMRSLLDRAVPLARFEVEMALELGNTASTGGRDQALEAAAAAIRPLPPSVLREELVQLVAGRLGLTENLVSSALLTGRRPLSDTTAAPPTNGARAALDRREQSERAFLAYCLALPDEGEQRLAAADLDALFSAPETRRAAEYLRHRLRSPAGELPAGDEPLARLVAELVIRAGQLEATPAKLELEALQLDLHNLDRRIATARTEGHERIHDLAAERQQVLDAIRHRLS
jgi:DNA primase